MFKTHKLCNRKIAHSTLEHAKIAAIKLKEQKGIIVFPYYCKHCKKYHTGKPGYKKNNKIFWENIDIKMKNKADGLNRYKKLLRGKNNMNELTNNNEDINCILDEIDIYFNLLFAGNDFTLEQQQKIYSIYSYLLLDIPDVLINKNLRLKAFQDNLNLSKEFLKIILNINIEDIKFENKQNTKQYNDNKIKNYNFVYIIKDSTRDLYKIGRTKNLTERLNTLRIANPDIEIIANKKTNYANELEIALHKKFKNFNYSGEWFSFNENQIDFIIDYFGFNKSILKRP